FFISACAPPSSAPGYAVEFLLFGGAEGCVHLFEVLAVLRESAPAVGKPQIILPAREVGGQGCQPLALGGPTVAVLNGLWGFLKHVTLPWAGARHVSQSLAANVRCLRWIHGTAFDNGKRREKHELRQ